MSRIYHIATRNALVPERGTLEARSSGEYRPKSLETEGFIHFSQRHQVLDVANAFYRGQTGLVILVVEPSLLKAELRYEAPATPLSSPHLRANQRKWGERSGPISAPGPENQFPHLYGPLNMDAVLEVVDFPPGAEGLFTLPPSLP